MFQFTRLRAAVFGALALTAYFVSATQTSAVAIFSNITFLNGWASPPGDTRFPGVSVINGVVHMKGAIAGGASAQAFQAPVGFRPASNVYVRVDLCNGVPGRIAITPSGAAIIETSDFARAQCRTSLEGASYALTTSGFTPLSLQNGWINGIFNTATAGARLDNGIVQLQGAVTGGTTNVIATLPPTLRPANDVYLPVTMCNSAPGRLFIQASTGLITAYATNGTLATAQCFVSLEGLSYPTSAAAFDSVTLENGWFGGAFGTEQPGVLDDSGILHFKGAVSSGSAARIFTLPQRFRPLAEVFVPVDLCNGATGSLRIGPNGTVGINATGPFSDAQCFTSLEGVSFPLTLFAPLTLANSWTGQPFGTGAPAIGRSGNIVTFSGAVANGTANQITTIGASFRPPTDVYVPVDLCNGARGRLLIQSTGAVLVQSAAGFADAQCFTSLEGVTYVIPNAATKPVTLSNGWVGGVFGTNTLRVQNNQGLVRFSGAIGSGTAAALFTLPVSLRPAASVYAPITLCNSVKGRLIIPTNGLVQVVPESGSFADAQCFTSLDGVEYQLNPTAGTTIATLNGWTAQPFGTYPVTVTDFSGVVRFTGAVAGGTTDVIATLPVKFRPRADVYVPVDLCNGKKGRLAIQSGGNLVVSAPGTFSDAQCFTSLEGVSYPL